MKNTNFVEGSGCSFFLSQLKNCEKKARARNPEYLLKAGGNYIKTQTFWGRPDLPIQLKGRKGLLLREKEGV